MKVSHRGRSPRRRQTLARFLSVSLSLLLLATAAPLGAYGARQGEVDTAAAQKGGRAEFVPGEALVRFSGEDKAVPDGATATVQVSGGSALGAILEGDLTQKVTASFERFDGSEIVPGLRLARLSTADPRLTLEAIAALDKRADVLYAEPNYIWRATATPNDPLFHDQYAMQRISAPAAWDITQGSESVVVAVLDGGVDLAHQDLAANAWTNPGETPGDNVDNDGNGFIDDVNGWDFANNDRTVFDGQTGDDHGTHVAGTIGARGNNGVGVTGVNWRVKIMSVKVLGPGGGTTANIVAGYNYVRMMKGRGVNVRVTNNSYGGPGFSQAAFNAISQLNDAGILFVAAAGNDASDNFNIPHFPTNYNLPNVIGVASTNTGDNLSGFSNFGARIVSMGAPGSGIQSTVPTTGSGGNPSGYASFNGTSMATPHVAGAAALVLSINPGISVAQLRGVLAFTGDRIDALRDKTTTGRRLNARAALDAAQVADNTPPAVVGLAVSAQSGRSVTLTFAAPGDDGTTGTAADYDFFFVDPATGLRILMPTNAVPAPGGTQQSVTVDTPFRSLNGTIELRAYDEHGNAATSSLPVNLHQNHGTDPYAVTTSAAEALSTGGERLAVDGDDKYFPTPQFVSGRWTFPAGYNLPFAFPFYGQAHTRLTVSTNGALYFSAPPVRDSGDADDVPSTLADLQVQTMIAGLWDDLEIDTAKRADAGIFVVQPDASRIIFRYQATTFPTPLTGGGNRGVHPVNFEIELRADGTVVMRYGGGNVNVVPMVGISGGEPAAYDIASHSSETALRNLTNAATVTFAPRPAGPSGPAVLQFSDATFAASETAGRALLTISRGGDPLAAGSVVVRTVDNTAAVRCDDTTTLPGVAFARCDYATTIEVVSFAAGEQSKTVSVPLVNDAHVEPNETVQITLSSPSGNVVLGAQTSLTLTITSDDAPGAANPLDGPPHDFFVRQQYLDFLSREPENDGLQAWLRVLNNCSNAYNHNPLAAAAKCDRNAVSMGFFRSPEFELKGLYVFRFYRAGLNRLPSYLEIVADMRAVTGATGAEVLAKKAAFAEEFTARQEFQAAFLQTTNAQFVDALLGRYQLQQIRTPDPAAPDADARVVITRDDLIARLGAGLSRAKALRAVADSDEVTLAERDRAFVAMQYFGYLRRDPDTAGFNSWMNYLAKNPGDYYTMVNGFVYSSEYRLRFGSQ